MQRILQVFGQDGRTVFALVRVARDGEAAGSVGHVADPSVFVLFPNHVRQVEENSLQKQDERHPLVVTVYPALVLSGRAERGGSFVADERMRNFRPGPPAGQSGQREGETDPAVSVEGVGSQKVVVADAVDGVADQIEGRDEDAGSEEDGTGEAVMQAEHLVVDVGSVGQVAHAKKSGHTSQQADDCHLWLVSASTAGLCNKEIINQLVIATHDSIAHRSPSSKRHGTRATRVKNVAFSIG